MSSVSPTKKRLLAAVTASFTLLATFLTLSVPANAASERSLVYESTTSTEGKSYELAYSTNGNRIFYTIDRGKDKPGAIGWIDADTGSRASEKIELSTAEPYTLAVDETRGRLLVLHYRVGTLDVINLATNQVEKTLTGLPASPYGIRLNTDTGVAYVYDKQITVVNVDNGTLSPVAISTQKYPMVRDTLYDPSSKLLWVAEGRASVLTAFDTATNTWLSDVSIPIGSFVYNGEAMGGRPMHLALDPVLHSLYVAVAPTMRDEWSESTKLITINTATRRHVGSPIILGNTVRQILVNPDTHEILSSNGYDNSVSLVSPSSWSVTNTVDLSAQGVTSGKGAGSADVWDMAFHPRNSAFYLVHPYSSRISKIRLEGTVQNPTVRPEAPGQTPKDSDNSTSTSWPGPAAPSSDPSALSNSTLTWGFSEYAQGWEAAVLGTKVSHDAATGEFTFREGKTSRDASTGTTTTVWSEGLSFKPYPGLVPKMKFIFGNPVLVSRPDGSGTLSMDMSVYDTNGTTKGYSRVTVATFAPGGIATVDKKVGEHITETLSATPEYAGRHYTDASGTTRTSSWPADFLAAIPSDMQAWFYASGASMDAKKTPLKVAALIVRPLDAQPSPQPEPTPQPEPNPQALRPTTGNSWVINGKEFHFGRATDDVFVGDWDGDGVATPGVRRGSTFYLSNSFEGGAADISFTFGRSNDKVLVGDWDGNGTDTIGLQRGNSYFLNNRFSSGSADIHYVFGRVGDSAIAGDFDGDGRDSVSVRRGDTVFQKNDLQGGHADSSYSLGKSTGQAVSGKWSQGQAADSISIIENDTLYVNDLVGAVTQSPRALPLPAAQHYLPGVFNKAELSTVALHGVK